LGVGRSRIARRMNPADTRRFRSRATPEWHGGRASVGPIARARRYAAEAVDRRIVFVVLACIVAAELAVAAGHGIGEANRVSAADDVQGSYFQDAFEAARRDAAAQGRQRGSEAGAREGRRAAERAGARAGARRGAAAAAREQAAIAAAARKQAAIAAAAERRARRAASAAETPARTTNPEPVPAAPAPAPPESPAEPCFDAAGFPC
jgi:hypothetical protein